MIRATPDRLHALVAEHGSPLNIVWPHAVADTVARMREALAAEGVDYEIFYGAKVNKSRALVRAAVAAGTGIDVSSLAECEDALRAGADPARLCATGPAKTIPFLRRLVAVGALVAVDSLEELDDLGGLHAGGRAGAGAPALPARFGRPLAVRHGPRGNPRGAARLAREDAPFAFEGFHLHLSGYDVERAASPRWRRSPASSTRPWPCGFRSG